MATIDLPADKNRENGHLARLSAELFPGIGREVSRGRMLMAAYLDPDAKDPEQARNSLDDLPRRISASIQARIQKWNGKDQDTA